MALNFSMLTHQDAGTTAYFFVHNSLVQADSGESFGSLTNHPHARNVDKYDLTPVPHAQAM